MSPFRKKSIKSHDNVGETLKRTRETLGLSLDTISKDTYQNYIDSKDYVVLRRIDLN